MQKECRFSFGFPWDLDAGHAIDDEKFNNRRKRRQIDKRAVAAIVEPLEQRALLTSVVVNTTVDALFPAGSGTVSLRNAIATADASTTSTTISFDSTVFASTQTIVLNGQTLDFSGQSEPITIVGPSVGVTIDGGTSQSGPIISVPTGYDLITMSNIAIEKGNAGGIANNGPLTLENCTISDNASNGITNGTAGTLNMVDDTVSDNTVTPTLEDESDYSGGGLSNAGTATLTNDTFFGNSASSGGAISNNVGTLTVTNVTISGNNATGGYGGGIYDFSNSTINISNSIVAGNTTSITPTQVANGYTNDPDVYGGFNSEGYNLIGATDGSTGFGALDLTGTAATPLDADLGPLADNGGLTQTMLPESGSPAIDHGFNGYIPSGVTTDQRGLSRIANGTVDIGAVEVGATAPVLSGSAINVAASTSQITPGSSVTFTATVTGTTATVPTGTVTFSTNGSSIGTSDVQNGIAMFATTSLSVGSDSITASYSGDGTYSASNSSPVTVIVSATPPSSAIPLLTRIALPATTIAGQKFNARFPIVVSNQGSNLKGLFTVNLYANQSNSLDGNQVFLTKIAKNFLLKNGKTMSVAFSIKSLPATLPSGAYYILVEVIDPTGATSTASSTTTVQVVAPYVSLSATVGPVSPSTVTVRRAGLVSITITNGGNIAATGLLAITMNPSTDGTTLLQNVLATYLRKTAIAAGKSKVIRLRIKVPVGLATGSYFPAASISLNENLVTAIGNLAFTVG